MTSKTAKGKKAAGVIKTRKSLTAGRGKKPADSDSEDDFKPTKAALAKKSATDRAAPTKPRALAKAKAVMDDFDDDDEDAKVKPLPRVRAGKAKVESDLEAPVVTSRKVSGKKPALPDSDSDVEMVPATAKNGAKKSTKRKRCASPRTS